MTALVFGVSACAPSSDSEQSTDTATNSSAVDVVRTVGWAEWPTVHAACLAEAGFPSSGVGPDGSVEYGPYDSAMSEDFDRADETCRAQYPVPEVTQQDSPEARAQQYAYLRDEWIPCMQDTFDIDVGQLPSLETYLADPNWLDLPMFGAALDAAVKDGRLEHPNAWWPECPDWDIPTQSS